MVIVVEIAIITGNYTSYEFSKTKSSSIFIIFFLLILKTEEKGGEEKERNIHLRE